MNCSYILISPVKNEHKYLRKTLDSVIAQTIQPTLWVIVSDHSTDGTDDLVREYSARYSFIKILRNDNPPVSNFGSKVHTFNLGLKQLTNQEYDYIGNLDGDVSFEPDYFEKVLSHFATNPKLGICGGRIYDVIGERLVEHNSSLNSVAGAVQLFRKACFESIGGYIPLEFGGIDTAAEICARASGWQVKTVVELKVLHHKPMNTGSKNYFAARMKQGKSNYVLGYHPLFQVFSCLMRLFDRPFFLTSLALLLGYFFAKIRKMPCKLPKETVKYLQKEQMRRLAMAFHLQH